MNPRHPAIVLAARDATIASLALCSALAGTAIAGPDWEESAHGDAGPLLSTAQQVIGVGTLSTIKGSLSMAADSDDFQDMYVIQIDCPTAISFSAGTDPSFGGGADFDTELWLFDANGFGLLGNKEVTPSSGLGGFGNVTTDGTAITVGAPGIYYIAVSGAGSAPVDSANNFLFFFLNSFEVSGPDGPGGANPIAGWSGPGDVGEYLIKFSPCAKFVLPPPCSGDLNGDGKVDGADLGILLSDWGACAGCPADLDGDADVDGADLGVLLALWGPCPPV